MKAPGRITSLAFLFLLKISMGNVLAQSDTLDPMYGDYIFTKSAEMVVVSKNTNLENKQLFFDFNEDRDSILLSQPQPSLVPNYSTPMELIAADFDNDARDEMISCEYQEAPGEIGFILKKYEMDSPDTQVSASEILFIPHVFEYGQVRMASGNFDNDLAKELVLAYVSDGKIKITLFEFDEAYDLVELASVLHDPLDPALGITARLDISTGDINNDGYDEIILGNILDVNYTFSGGNTTSVMDINLNIYNYSNAQNILSSTFNEELSYSYTWYNEGLDGIRTLYIERFGLTAGDFDADGYDELNIGFVQQNDWYDGNGILKNDNYKWFQVFMLTVDVSPDFSSYEQIPSALPARHTYATDNLTNWPVPNATAFSMISADLNMDQRDELIVYEGYGFNICSFDDDLVISDDHFETSNLILDYDGHRLIGVEKLEYDTLNQECVPHIFALGFSLDLKSTMHTTSPHPQGEAYLSVYKPVFNIGTKKCQSLELIDTHNLSTNNSLGELTNYHLAVPDFDGDGIRFGPPVRIKESVIDPIIVLNSPPVHFDVFDNTPYDICMSFIDNIFNSCVTHEQGIETIDNVQTSITHDVTASFGLQLDLTFNLFGKEFGQTIESQTDYAYQNYKEGNVITTINEVSNRSAASDDMILALSAEYVFWEYPVYGKNKNLGHILILEPAKVNYTWFSSDHLIKSFLYKPEHEIGNVLSYPYDDNNLNAKVLLGNPPTQTINTSPASNSENYKSPTWTLKYSNFDSEILTETHSINQTLKTTVEAGIVEASLSGGYGYNNMHTTTTSIDSTSEISVFLYAIDPAYSDAEYTVLPYVYRDLNNVLIVDYITEIYEPLADTANWNWWQRNYKNNPDPSFVLPWRLEEEKGYAETGYKNFTRDIDIISPVKPEKGDTATIEVCIRNFSLKGLVQPVTVQLFLGHPDNGGSPIIDILGNTVFTMSDDILPREHKKLSVNWKIPSNIAPNARIYAVLDRDNNIEEIHEDNNIGFTYIFVEEADGTAGSQGDPVNNTSTIGSQPDPGEEELLIYPNPASEVLWVNLPENLPDTEITYSIYSIDGQKLASDVIYNEIGNEDHQVLINEYDSGVYIITFVVDHNKYTRKFIVK